MRRPFLIALTALMLAATHAPARAADTYVLDPAHTAVVFHINHFGFSNPSGKFMNIEGELVLDEKKPANSTLKVTIPVTKVDSGVPKLDEHLQAKEFFDSATYPTATYESTSVKVTGKDTALVTGNLTLRGVTKPLTLKVKLNKIADNMMKVKTAGFSATASLKRSDFGMDKYAPMLGDDVALSIETEANLKGATPVTPKAE